MSYALDAVLVVIFLLDFIALGTSRMRALIRASAAHGALLGVMPLLVHGGAGLRLSLVCVGTVAVKGVIIPALLTRAIRSVTTHREIEPVVGFTASLLLGGAGAALALVFSDSLPLLDEHADSLLVPAAFSTVFTGFLILTTRKKAVIQIVGYLILENGIFIFGLLLIEAMPFTVELGVLLDVFVAVFVMGIILNHIQRTFSSTDTARLVALRE